MMDEREFLNRKIFLKRQAMKILSGEIGELQKRLKETKNENKPNRKGH